MRAKYSAAVKLEIKRLKDLAKLMGGFTPLSLSKQMDVNFTNKKDIDQILSSLDSSWLINWRAQIKKPALVVKEQKQVENPVGSYLAKLAKDKLLTREQEVVLAKAIEEGKEDLLQVIFKSMIGQQLLINKIDASLEDLISLEDLVDGLEEANAYRIKKAKTQLQELRGLIDRNVKNKQWMQKAQIIRFSMSTVNKLVEELKIQGLNQDQQKQVVIAQAKIQKSKNELVTHNLRLVASIAKKYKHSELTYLDFIQEGNLGLIKAVEKFEYRQGNKFSTYATWWIRQTISRSISDKGRTVRVPVHMSENLNKIKNAERALFNKFNRPATDQELATALNMSAKKLEQARISAKAVLSLDTPMSKGDDQETYLEFVREESSLEHNFMEKDSNSKVKDFLLQLKELGESDPESGLTDQEYEVVLARFGFTTDSDLTLEEIGQSMGRTRERVRQIETKALAKLEQYKERISELTLGIS